MFELEEIEGHARRPHGRAMEQPAGWRGGAIRHREIATALPAERRQWLEASRTYVPQTYQITNERFELLLRGT